jgi:hypothetical protein
MKFARTAFGWTLRATLHPDSLLIEVGREATPANYDMVGDEVFDPVPIEWTAPRPTDR